MSLQSQLFRGDPKLEAAAVSPTAHIQTGAVGAHVGKIQQALIKLDSAAIDPGELQSMRYGPSTTKAVLSYKQKRGIINRSYQSQADAIVGKMTIAALDQELLKKPPSPTSKLILASLVSLPVPKEWFVTSLSLATFSAVVAFGFTAATGTIKFEQPNGDSITLPIGLLGPSAGLSLVPNVRNLLSKVPGLNAILTRFPALKQFILREPLNNDLLLAVIRQQSKIVRVFGPTIAEAIEKVAAGLSGGLGAFPSGAIGLVSGRGGRELQKADFSGPCICFSVGGTVGPGNFGIFVLFFGLDRSALDLVITNPIVLVDLIQLEAHSKGVAVISAASVSAALPGLGAGATIFFGEIV